MKRWLQLPLILCVWTVLSAHAQMPDKDHDTPVRYKLTVGYYQYSQTEGPTSPGTDINLRQTSSLGNLWAAHYDAGGQSVTQTRLGWDQTWTPEAVRVTPSLQLASGGAWNGSLGLETGQREFGGVAVGRTNLRDTLSLNFDPNDMYSVWAGYRWSEVHSLTLQLVRDNRLHPDQQHVHLLYRTPLPDEHRLTVDLLFKSGLVNNAPIERTGLAVTYDWPRWFVRIAWDPNTNFTSQDMLRWVLGTRF